MTRGPLVPIWILAMMFLSARPALSQPPLVVRGQDTCPSADAIRAALQTLRPAGEWPSQTVEVDVSDDHLSLTLGDGPGAQRELPAAADCPTRAETVALVLTAWAGGLPSQPTDAPVLTVEAPVPAPVRMNEAPNVIELDGAPFYSPIWGHALGAWLGLGRTPRNGGVGARVLAAYQSGRNLAIEGGTNQVLRFLVGAALTYHLQRRHVFASGDVGLVGTLTRAQGAGYATNSADTTANFGGVADLRGGLRLGRYRLWVNARLLRLVYAENVKIQSSSPGLGNSASLSPWDAQLGAGVGFRFE
ncbi:MAG TPA: hypothetical protein VF518_09875 [Polyangia bacterium]